MEENELLGYNNPGRRVFDAHAVGAEDQCGSHTKLERHSGPISSVMPSISSQR